MTNRFTTAWALIALLLLQFVNSLVAAEGAGTLQSNLLKLADRNATVRADTLMKLAKIGDPKLAKIFEAYKDESLYLWDDNGTIRVVMCEEIKEDEDTFEEFAPLADPLTRAPIRGNDGKQIEIPLEDLEEISASRKDRIQASNAISFIDLFSPKPEKRREAAERSGLKKSNVLDVKLLREVAQNDPVKKIRYLARESQLMIQLRGNVPGQTTEGRIAAARQLAEMKSILRGKAELEAVLDQMAKDEKEGKPVDADLRLACQESFALLKKHEATAARIVLIFQGLSLGTVLILMALGLAITFGLMGVINMAHGELMMIGAYTTYEMQRWFNHTSESPQNHYYLWALPAAFLVAALVGLLMEALVIRHLYRRPLESLLATFGISLILIQIVRLNYGDSSSVNAPQWAVGSIEDVVQNVDIVKARLIIMGICLASVIVVWFIMNKTRIGLHIRATMQSRDMARSLGVNIRWVDQFTFAFGAGLAGLAGCALMLIGGPRPDMGQTYIVDTFLVVVTGGVGELLGVVCSGLGIGAVTKAIEPETGAVWAKIFMLIAVIIFIQFRPAGLFAPKGRLADDQ